MNNLEALHQSLSKYPQFKDVSLEQFQSDLKDETNRKDLYNSLTGIGKMQGMKYEDFSAKLGYGGVELSSPSNQGGIQGMSDEDLESKYQEYLGKIEEANKVKGERMPWQRKDTEVFPNYKPLSETEAEVKRQMKWAYEESPDIKAKDKAMSEVDEKYRDVLQERIRRQGAGLKDEVAEMRDYLSTLNKKGETSILDRGNINWLLKNTEEVISAPSKHDNTTALQNVGNYFKGFGNKISDRDTWSFGMTEIARNINLGNVLKRLSKGEKVSSDEELLLSAFMTNMAAHDLRDDLSLAYQAGSSFAESVPFMAEFAILGGVTPAIKRGIVRTVAKTLGKTSADMVSKMMAKELFSHTFGNVARTAMMPSTHAEMSRGYLDAALENKDYSAGDQLRHFGNALKETVTERSVGGLLDRGASAVGRKILGDRAKGLTRFGEKWENSVFRNVPINSPFGETAEEYAGAGIDYLRSFNPLYSEESNKKLRDEAEYLFSEEGTKIMAGSILPMTMLPIAYNVWSNKRHDNRFEKINQGLQKSIANSLYRTVEPELPKDFQLNDASVVAAVANEQESYNAMQAALKDTGVSISPELISQPREEQLKVLEEVFKADNLNQEQKTIIGNYISAANSSRMIREMEAEQDKKDIEARRSSVMAEADEKRGSVTHARIAGQDKPVAVTGVSVKMNEDGKLEIDPEKSDDVIAYINEDGKAIPATVNDLLGIEDSRSVDELFSDIDAEHEQLLSERERVRAEDLSAYMNRQSVEAEGVPDDEIKGMETTPQAEIKTPEPQTTETGVTPNTVETNPIVPEISAEEAERNTFMQSLPVFESGKDAGKIDQSRMSPDQTLKYFEYSRGREETVARAQKRVEQLNAQLEKEREKLNDDPFNIAQDEVVSRLENELSAYKNYIDSSENRQEETPVVDVNPENVATPENVQEETEPEVVQETPEQIDDSGVTVSEPVPNVQEESSKQSTEETPNERVPERAEMSSEEKVKILQEVYSELKDEVEKLSKFFHTPVQIHYIPETVENKIAREASAKGIAKGWYLNGEVHIFLPNNLGVEDVQETFLHEVVAHKGVRDMFGDKHGELMESLFDILPENDQKRLLEKYGDKRIAADEYLAEIAEKGKFESEEQKGVFDRIVEAIREFLLRYDIQIGEFSASEIADVLLKESAARLKSGDVSDGPKFTGDISAYAKDINKRNQLRESGKEVDKNPSEKQKEAGNYKKGHVNVQGFDITIENPKGSTRSGVDESGKEWHTTMQNDYGYFKRSKGKDGDQIDVFVGDNPESGNIFVVDQVNPETGEFDESKVMLGFNSEAEARSAYLSNYEDGWQGLGSITETDAEYFKEWLYDGKKQRKAFSEYKEVKEDDSMVLSKDEYSERELKKHYDSQEKDMSFDEWRDSEEGVDAENKILDTYPNYIKGLSESGELQKIWNKSNIGDQIKIRKNVEASGMDIHELIDTKAHEEENKQSDRPQDGITTIKFYDGSIIRGKIVERKDGKVTINSSNGRYTVTEDREMPDYQGEVHFRMSDEESRIKERALADGTFMKAPNGKPTNLNERQWVQVRTEAFKKWFGDWENNPESASKVVDENGEPLVVYHGAGDEFFKFDGSTHYNGGTEYYNEDFSFFTPFKQTADLYGYYASLRRFAERNNLKYDDNYSFEENNTLFEEDIDEYIQEKYGEVPSDIEEWKEMASEYFDDWFEKEMDIRTISVFLNLRSPKIVDKYIENKDRREEMETFSSEYDNGKYDGAIFNKINDSAYFDGVKEGKTIVATSPTQIKSATDNVGTFDKGNDDIRFRIAGEQYVVKGDIDTDDNVRTGLLEEIRMERTNIEASAKADGTWLKGPNGEATNLTPEQWVTVRTKRFKQWFGDWEKTARIEKLRKAKPVEITGKEYEGKYELNRDSARDWALNNLRGEYTNKSTKENIFVGKVGIKEVTSHSSNNAEHLKSLVAIPDIIENTIFIDELPNEKNNGKYDSYRYYVGGLKIGGEDYTVKMVVGVKSGNKYYDHRLTKIEKGKLLDHINSQAVPQKGFTATGDEPLQSYALSEYKDSKLISLLQTNSSKVVDENGEPLVVYHGTSHEFNTFKYNEADSQGSYLNAEQQAFFFANYDVANMYGNGILMPAFLNIKDAQHIDVENEIQELLSGEGYDSEEEAEEYGYPIKIWKGEESREFEANDSATAYFDFNAQEIYESAKDYDKDGIIVDGTDGSHVYIAFNSNQIKSAVDNEGTFDSGNDDIRFRESNEKPVYRKGQSIGEYAVEVDKWNKKQGGDVRFRKTDNAGFYSTIEDALDKIKQDKGGREQFKAMLLKNGAKQAEIDWMGFDELPDKLTKSDIQDWINKNKIEVEEILKEQTIIRGEDTGMVDFERFIPERQEEYDELKSIAREWFDIDSNKYHGYEPSEEEQRRINEWEEEYGSYNNIVDYLIPELEQNPDNFEPLDEVKDDTKYSYYKLPGGENYRELLLTMPGSKTDFEARHFDKNNIVAHVRFDERYAYGERVLFIEEVQSDWAQEGKREGFRARNTSPNERLKEIDELQKKGVEKYGVFEWLESPEYKRLSEEYSRIKDGLYIPDMPFKKTDQWVNLAMRRMMRYASENGFDRIAWTTGEQQTERYNLSKNVDRIVVDEEDGKYSIMVWPKGKETHEEVATVSRDRLPDYIGKDLSERVIKDGGGDFSGDNLKIGGSGMKSFYDNILPNAIKKLGKPFGANLETVVLDEIGEQQSIPVTDSMREGVSQGVPLFRESKPAYHEGQSIGEYAKEVNKWNEAMRFRVEMPSKDRIPKPPVFTKRTPVSEIARLIEEYRKANKEVFQDVNEQMAKISNFYTSYIDRGRPLEKFLYEMVGKGALIRPSTDAYNAFMTSASRSTHLIQEFEKTKIEPLQKRLRGLVRSKLLDNLPKYQWDVRDEDTGEVLNKKKHNKKVSKLDRIGLYLQAKDIVEAQELGLKDRGAEGFVKTVRLLNHDGSIGKGVKPSEYIAEFESAVGKETINKIWEDVRAVNRWTLDLQLEYGLITKEVYDKYADGSRKFYVPQRGWRERDLSDTETFYVTHKGESPSNPFNSALIKAQGRKSLAGDPLAYMQSIGESSVMAAIKNHNKQVFLDFAMENKEFGHTHDFFSFKRVYYVKSVERDAEGNVQYKRDEDGNILYEASYAAPTAEQLKQDKETRQKLSEIKKERLILKERHRIGNLKNTEFVKSAKQLYEEEQRLRDEINVLYSSSEANVIQHSTNKEKKQHVVVVKKDGADYEIMFSQHYGGERVANVLNRKFSIELDSDDAFKVKLRSALRKGTRYMSAMMTQYNPLFAAKNFIRDVGFASVSNVVEFGMGYQVDFSKNIMNPGLQRAVWKYALSEQFDVGDGIVNSKYGQYMKEFMEDGAATGWSFLKDIEQLRVSMKRAIEPKAWEEMWSSNVNPLVFLKNSFGTLTSAAELTTRFAEYVTSREQTDSDGNAKYSREEAAMHAKEVSVNFDRKGAYNGMGMVFSFFNATIQGTNKMLRLLRDPKIRRKMTGVFVGFFTAGFWNAMLTPDGDDDDREFTEYELMQNLCIGDVKIPLPQGLRAFWGMGTQAALAVKGKKHLDIALLDGSVYFFGEVVPQQVVSWMNLLQEDDRTGKISLSKDLESAGMKKMIRDVVPTMLQPFADVLLNVRFTGSSVYRREFRSSMIDTRAEHSLGKANVPEAYLKLSKLMGELGGLDTTDSSKIRRKGGSVSSLVDVNPSAMQSLVEGYSAGTGRFIADMIGMIWDAADPDKKVDLSKTQLGNAFWKQPKEFTDADKDAMVLNRRMAYYKDNINTWKSENPMRYGDIRNLDSAERRLFDAVQSGERALKKWQAYSDVLKISPEGVSDDKKQLLKERQESARAVLKSDELRNEVKDALKAFDDFERGK